MASERRWGFCRFTLDPFSHHISLYPISTFHLPHGNVIAGFWIVSKYLRECCPCGLHSVISRLLAGGSLGFRLCPCCFPAQRLLYGIFGILLFRSCFLLPYQSLRWYNDIIFSSTLQMPVNCSADHRPCWFLVCFLGVFVCFVWFWVFVVCFSV